MNMVRIEGKQLEQLQAQLARKDVRYIRISWHDDHVTVKVNEGIWSPPIGTKQLPY